MPKFFPQAVVSDLWYLARKKSTGTVSTVLCCALLSIMGLMMAYLILITNNNLCSLICGLFSKRKITNNKIIRARIPRLLGPKPLYVNVLQQKWHILTFCGENGIVLHIYSKMGPLEPETSAVEPQDVPL